MGREAKITNKLTKKQSGFVKDIISGKSATQAAMSAYNTTDTKVARVIASQNLTKLNILKHLYSTNPAVST
jgi:phage terminase small subunit